MVSYFTLFIAAAVVWSCPYCASFQHTTTSKRYALQNYRRHHRLSTTTQLHTSDETTTIEEQESHTKPSLNHDIAQQVTIQVCTSTSCSKKLQQMNLDEYHVLGEIYAYAQSANVEKCMVIEDGGCQGGKNCKLGPCVSIMHEDYDGNIGLEGMNANELQERVYVCMILLCRGQMFAM